MNQNEEETRRGLIQTESKLGANSTFEPNHFSGGTRDTPTPEEQRKKKIKWIIIGVVAGIAILLAILLPILLIHKDSPPSPPLEYYNPYTLDPKDIQTFPARITGILRATNGYNPEHHSQAFGKLMSKMKGDTLQKNVDSKQIPKGVNNNFVQNLNFTFAQVQWRVSHLVITDADSQRFSIPKVAVPNPDDNLDMRLDMTGFKMNTEGTFGFSFSDPLFTDNKFLDTTECSLLFMDKFIQMDFNLPSQRLFGFGERIHEFALKEGAWNMWAHGQPSPYDDGSGRKGEYGVHPFLLVGSQHTDDFYGMYFRNANAMTPIITFNDDGTSKLSFITVGGQIEIFFFIHGSAQDVIKKYQEFMGARPKLPPFWSLGWMQTSYAWKNQSMVEAAVGQYRQQGFPLDAIFLDIPYMDNYVDFTVDKKAFPNISALADDLHAHSQHLIPIIDAAISAEDITNPFYTQGNQDDIFIKSTLYNVTSKYNHNLVNKVWPKVAVFVDWFNDKCTNMWFMGLDQLYTETKYDGIWVDMNEPWGFETAELDPNNIPTERTALKEEKKGRFLEGEKNYAWYETFPQDKDSTYYVPFIPDFQNYQSYDNNTISLNATNPSMNTTQYNLHDFYGHMMAKRTAQYFTQLKDTDPRKDKRSFVLTRSTFTSTGSYASHWLGDNYREYRFMNYSVAGIMNFNMFGIPHVGADVCGFFGSARNDPLCAKWAQLATFYPFARFHYDIDSPPNEPYLMQEPYYSITRRTMFDRYQYMRQLYTCLFEVSKNGGTCFDPQFYYFPSDPNTYNNIESTFIFAGAIKVTPSLTETDKNTTPSYFPAANGQWAALHNLGQIIAGNGTFDLDSTTQSVNAHLMPGKIIAFQNNSDMTINKMSDLINAPISLIVNLDNNGYAKGSLFLDGGESVSELNNWNYEYYNFHISQKSIQVQFQEGHRGSQAGYNLDSIKFLNGQQFLKHDTVCYLSISNKLQPVLLNQEWIPSENAYVISARDAPIRFHDIHSIHISTQDELNPCNPEHFRYKVKGSTPDLRGKSQVVMQLEPLSNHLPPINATLRILQGGILNIKWTWTDGSATGKTAYEVPNDYISTEDKPLFGDLSKFIALSSNPFQISFLYDDASQSQFFRLDGMIYHDYLNWIKVQAFTESGDKFKGVFGLGERANFDFFYKDGVYSMWTKDIPTPIETGDLPASNMYGNHPYFMYKHKANAWVGVLYKLAAAQDWWIQNSPVDGRVSLQTVAVGGVADIYIMMGSTPEAITQKYYSLIGYPVLIPQWGLGWNQCRYGYRDVATLESVLSGYRDNGFPLDVMWSDIDYMQNYRNFLYDDQLAFKGLPDFIQKVHDLGLKYVPILDAGTAARPLKEENYPEYLQGEKDKVFMTINGETFIGQVWPNDAAFPDFFAPQGISWWTDNLSEMHKKIQFDGLWLDMNEASNFCVGVCYQRQSPAKPVKTMLKYIPTGRDLEVQSMPLDTMHADGNISLDTHSLYGIQEIKVTHEWFQNVQKQRTFIIERSSFAGMGKWASRWLGDNFSEEKFMKLSVSGVMLMSMFGIPVSGADICGFLGNTNENLCIKWHFVGAFYPFSRNHNGGQVAQEPYVWSKPAQAAMKDAIRLKYSLVRYYYTSLFDISTKGTGTFYKPLFFEFPEDNKAFANIEYSPMLGSALKLSMNPESLTQKTTEFYFPAGLWCKLKGNTGGENCFTSKGQTKTYPSDLTDYQLHLREGFIVPMQDTSNGGFNTTQDLKNWPVDFHALGSATSIGAGQWSASGRYINDDGVALINNLAGNVNSYTLFANYDGTSTITVLIGMDQQATNYNVQDDGCVSVNKNDYLASLSFYNAHNYGLDAPSGFDVSITLKPDNEVTKIAAVSDPANDRLFFQMSQGSEICMSRIVNIKISKKA